MLNNVVKYRDYKSLEGNKIIEKLAKNNKKNTILFAFYMPMC